MKTLTSKAYLIAKIIERYFPGIRLSIVHDKRLVPAARIISGQLADIVKFDVRIEDADWDKYTAIQIAESFSDRFTAIIKQERYKNALARRRVLSRSSIRGFGRRRL